MSNPVFKIAADTPVEMTLDDALDAIVAAQKQAAELKKHIDGLKAPVKAELKRRELVRYTNPRGVTAKFYVSKPLTPDKELAVTLLTPEQFVAIWQVKVVENFKVS